MTRLDTFLQNVQVQYNGQSVSAEVVGSFQGNGQDDIRECCNVGASASSHSLNFCSTELSAAAFQTLSPGSQGPIQVNWNFA